MIKKISVAALTKSVKQRQLQRDGDEEACLWLLSSSWRLLCQNCWYLEQQQLAICNVLVWLKFNPQETYRLLSKEAY